MTRRIAIQPLSREAFAPFGDMLATEGAHHFSINDGMVDRYHALATIALAGPDPKALISIFRGRPYALPLTLEMVERHPLGSQAFMPLHRRPFLVVVAPDMGGTPGVPLAFRTPPGVGVNIGIGVWHGVLTPLEAEGDFLVVDRGGEGDNLEVHRLAEPYRIEEPGA